MVILSETLVNRPLPTAENFLTLSTRFSLLFHNFHFCNRITLLPILQQACSVWGGWGRRRCNIHPVARCSSSSRVLNGRPGWGTQHLAERIFILTFHGHSFGGRLQNPSGRGQGDDQNSEKHNHLGSKLAFTPLLELPQRNTQKQKNVTCNRIRVQH